MKALILTNNPMVSKMDTDINISYEDCTLLEVLIKARDLIHKGHILLTHPLSGSVKPNETPYKSLIVSESPQKEDYYDSLKTIEQSIQTVEKFLKIANTPEWSQKILEDFQVIDCTLIKGAIISIL